MNPKILFIVNLPPPIHGASMMGKYIQESLLINNEFDTDFINLSTSTNLKESGKRSMNKVVKLLAIQAKIYLLFNNCFNATDSGQMSIFRFRECAQSISRIKLP